MDTRPEGGATAASWLEISVYWKDGQPPVVARIAHRQARELVARVAFMAPDELEAAVEGVSSEHAQLLLGMQTLYRLLAEHGASFALADLDGALWTIPASSVGAIRLRLVGSISGAPMTLDPIELRLAFDPRSPAPTEPC